MSSFYGSTYYWFAILVMAVIAITIWCWKCHKQGQARQEEILARNRHLLQLQLQLQQEEVEERPSNYQPDAPPAYDDVINKPEDYPVYHEGSTSTTMPSSPEHRNLFNDSQPLPSYEDAVHFASLFPEDSNVASANQQINDGNQLEHRTTESSIRIS